MPKSGSRSGVAGRKPAQLSVNLVSNPMAVPAGQGIWFSWAAHDARQGETQHGYQLRQDFDSRTGATWPLNIGQVYTTLGRLSRDGLVETTET